MTGSPISRPTRSWWSARRASGSRPTSRVRWSADGPTPSTCSGGCLRRSVSSERRAPPPFQGGAVGYLAYELAHHLERLPRTAVDDLGLPDMNIGLYDWVIAQDGWTGETWVVSSGLPDGSRERAEGRLRRVLDRMDDWSGSPGPVGPPPGNARTRSNFSREEYLRAVRAVKRYIVEGGHVPGQHLPALRGAA